jgi:hypothetical protein
MPISALCGLTIFTTIAALLLGGGTRAGYLSDALLQLLSLPLLLTALSSSFRRPSVVRPRGVMVLCLAIIGLPLIQLAPLPPAVWTTLPGRDILAESFRLIGLPQQWAPISVAPFSTHLAVLSLIPPLAVFFGALSLQPSERRLAILSLLPVGALSVFLGLIQVAQGPASAMRFFQFTNANEAVGFFANRNHFGALLYCLILVAAVWVSDTASSGVGGRTPHQKFSAGKLAALLAGMAAIAIMLSGEALARSRAGALFAFVALGGAFIVNRADPRRATTAVSTSKLLVGAVLLSGALSLEVIFNRFLARVIDDPFEDYRWTIASRSFEAAKAFFPMGSGVGSFVQVYALFERAQDSLQDSYVNRAHDDYLEALIEGGVFSAALIAGFIFWWIVTTRKAWRPLRRHEMRADTSFRRASTLIVGLLLAHSLVDYPLHTSAMMVVFALACALTLAPQESAAATTAASLPGGQASQRGERRGRPEGVAEKAPQPIKQSHQAAGPRI